MTKRKHWAERLMDAFGFERHDIGRPEGIYLTRWVILGTRFGAPGRGKLFLHLFHRGDEDKHRHDHPWPFWSLILQGGYHEEAVEESVVLGECHRVVTRRWYGPGSLLRRPAEWQHRVLIDRERQPKTLTLVWAGKKSRTWGFWCNAGWLHWKKYLDGVGCGE